MNNTTRPMSSAQGDRKTNARDNEVLVNSMPHLHNWRYHHAQSQPGRLWLAEVESVGWKVIRYKLG